MKVVFKNIVTILLILVLLPATGGVTVFHHVCNIDGSHNTAIFAQSSCEHHQYEQCDCDSESTTNCTFQQVEHCVEFAEYLVIDAKFVLEKVLEIKKSESISNYINFNNCKKIEKPFLSIKYPDKSKIPIIEYIQFQNLQSRNKVGEDHC